MSSRKSQRGASIIVFALLLTFVLLPIVGLAVDVSIQYWIKAKLNSAVDSAALSAARSLNVGTTISSQTLNAQTVGRQYFSANFPAGILGTTIVNGQDASYPNSPTIRVVAPSNYITVTVTAQAQVPLYFLTLLHLSTGTITATSQTTRRNANVMIVLDRSGSMKKVTNGVSSCATLVQSVQTFADQFIDGRDQLGLVTFSTAAEVDYTPTTSFKSGTAQGTLDSKIASMVCVGATSTEQGLWYGYDQLKTVINQPGALNVIVFFTDGGANGVYAYFPVKTLPDNGGIRYDYANFNNFTTYPASSCATTGTILGLWTEVSDTLNLTGYTAGVLDVAAARSYGITGGLGLPPAVSSSGCSFDQNNSLGWGPASAREDIAYIPAKDYDQNLTAGYKPSITYPSSDRYPNAIRADSPEAVRNAAMNVADNLAQKIRGDTVYAPVVYTIGLSGNENVPMDNDFLERMANDPRASNKDSTLPVGKFILASSNSELTDAFNAIASQILRLSR